MPLDHLGNPPSRIQLFAVLYFVVWNSQNPNPDKTSLTSEMPVQMVSTLPWYLNPVWQLAYLGVSHHSALYPASQYGWSPLPPNHLPEQNNDRIQDEPSMHPRYQQSFLCPNRWLRAFLKTRIQVMMAPQHEMHLRYFLHVLLGLLRAQWPCEIQQQIRANRGLWLGAVHSRVPKAGE